MPMHPPYDRARPKSTIDSPTTGRSIDCPRSEEGRVASPRRMRSNAWNHWCRRPFLAKTPGKRPGPPVNPEVEVLIQSPLRNKVNGEKNYGSWHPQGDLSAARPGRSVLGRSA